MPDKIKLLILEDNKIFQKNFIDMAKRHSFEVLGIASTAKDLLQQIQEKKPQVLILDLVIPEEDVLDLIRSIKKTYPSIPLIACSSLKEDYVVSRVLQAGCFDYISKPFTGEELQESIQQAVA